MKRLICWWFGCEPDYEAVYYDTNREGWSEAVPCKRCDAPDTSYADRVGDTRHNRLKQWLHSWLFRRWCPAKCGDCGKRRSECRDCIPF
jgi:hypothetical protein